MNAKTINFKTMLVLFLCLFTSVSYCASTSRQAGWRVLGLIGFGAGLGQAVRFGLDELEKEKAAQKEIEIKQLQKAQDERKEKRYKLFRGPQVPPR